MTGPPRRMTHGPTHHTQDATPDRTDELASRLSAVERTLTGADTDVSSLEDVAAIEGRISDLESAVASLSDRLDDVDAATQAIRGYVGGVRTVNEDVERRANAALAKAEALEDALVDESGLEHTLGSSASAFDERTTAGTPDRDTTGDAGLDHVPQRERADSDASRGLAARLRDAL